MITELEEIGKKQNHTTLPVVKCKVVAEQQEKDIREKKYQSG